MGKKLKSNKGFTLSEVLVTILILTMVTSVIAGGVMVVRNAYNNVTLKAEAQTLRSTTISAMVGELRYAENIETDASGNIVFDSPSRGYRIYYKAENTEITVYALGSNSVPLLTDKTQTDKLQAWLTSISYDSDKCVFSFNIKVINSSSNNKVVAGDDTAITVCPINH